MKAKVLIQSNKFGVINIVIADDNPIERLGLRTLLDSEPNFKVVGEASNGLEAVRLVKQLSPDVVILDSNIPSMNGVEAPQQIRAQFPHIRIVILSSTEGKGNITEDFHNVDAYVFDQSPTEDLLNAIHEVLARRHYIRSPLEIGNNSTEENANTTKKAESDPHESLTPRERAILILVSQGYTSIEIGQKLKLSTRTVESHRSNIMHKLGFKSSIQLTRFALEHRLIPIK